MKYYVNKNIDTEWKHHEVHTLSCSWCPIESNRIYLWDFDSCWPAKAEAKRLHYNNSDWCKHCCNACHTG